MILNGRIYAARMSGRVESPLKVSNDLSVVMAMLNELSPVWHINDERVRVLAKSLRHLPKATQVVVEGMIAEAGQGGKFWTALVERQAAVFEISKTCRMPTKQEISDVVKSMRAGAEADGVSDKAWAKEALDVLSRLATD